MNLKASGSIFILAAGLLSLSLAAVSSSHAQDRPGAASPTATAAPGDWAPRPPGLNTTPSYGGPAYRCAGPAATPSNEFPPCPPGTATISNALPSAAQGQKNVARVNASRGPREVDHPGFIPPSRLDPRIEAWMNSPAYKAWAATHSFKTPLMYQCGSGKSARMSSTPCK